MKFMVSRTSEYNDEKPCDEAVQLPCVRFDSRTTDDPAKINAHKGKSIDWWYGEGRNHRVENGRIVRDFDATEWFVELNSLEELVAFEKKYGSLVIERWALYGDQVRIEIYDDYRE